MAAIDGAEVSVVGGVVTKHRFRSKQERRLIAEESLVPGASAAVVARSHGVNANQVFHWRKLYREGLLEVKPTVPGRLMPVRIIEPSANREPTRTYTGTIQIERGRVRVRIEGAVDPTSLRMLLEHFDR